MHRMVVRVRQGSQDITHSHCSRSFYMVDSDPWLGDGLLSTLGIQAVGTAFGYQVKVFLRKILCAVAQPPVY